MSLSFTLSFGLAMGQTAQNTSLVLGRVLLAQAGALTSHRHHYVVRRWRNAPRSYMCKRRKGGSGMSKRQAHGHAHYSRTPARVCMWGCAGPVGASHRPDTTRAHHTGTAREPGWAFPGVRRARAYRSLDRRRPVQSTDSPLYGYMCMWANGNDHSYGHLLTD